MARAVLDNSDSKVLFTILNDDNEPVYEVMLGEDDEIIITEYEEVE